jgi:mannose/fructose-specific phosphotransferase system component IIA
MNTKIAPQEEIKRRLNDIAHAVVDRLPEGYGFIVMTFPFGDSPENVMNYVSNARREDAIRTCKEWLLKCGAAEDWMQHIK